MRAGARSVDAAITRAVAGVSGTLRFATVVTAPPGLVVTLDGDDRVPCGRLSGVTLAVGDVVLWAVVRGQPVVVGAVVDLPPDTSGV